MLAALIVPVIQFQTVTVRNLNRAAEFRACEEAGLTRPGDEPPKEHKGAIGRWRKAVIAFWDGENIYKQADSESPVAPEDSQSPTARKGAGKVWLHPNMPFVIILLTPLAYLPVVVMSLVFCILKVLALIAAMLMAIRVVNHNGKRMPDWVFMLGFLWCALLIVGDIQHGNTNGFVLAAIVLHLWLYRRGNDVGAGAAIALAVCLKMTPALFLIYWLYQRNWRLLISAACAMVAFAVVVPAVAVGPARYMELTGTWLENLIVPGLLKGAWYPIHINQSAPGVFSRYLLDGADGNIFWNPDDTRYGPKVTRGWITLAAMDPATVKMLIRVFQVAVVGLAAWAIGWRKLSRDDGRRSLHYGVIVIAMLMLNQRTWDHHAGILLIAHVAVWYAIAFGNFARAKRAVAITLVLLAGPLVWLTGTGTFKLLAMVMGKGKEKVLDVWVAGAHVIITDPNKKPMELADVWADVAKAYGPTFLHFVLLFIAAVILCVSLKKTDRPYCDERQKLFGK